ncbi:MULTISPECIES: hypothetical protein [Rhizobium/Agrobacterium group]|uniref:Uncharacterized protein n=1 Tax=Agrobacterium vitis TaxID=373 RepID=A0A6A9UH20_AGRVI|nr:MULTISPECIES: hypothetical protein [Rhizobium/Agrobacterium group]MBF2715959.1 hypothetical protein [Agrobacterium vitis]MCM2439964.1 hypothetical protein [Agrobacterium vitis]MCM2451598.1 hypothetical protein [Agrobacterium vitis]MCM2469298.1 hypothetical protein [Agrobacterium vitis]MUO27338.1 hypothetical protein [Agrobacterium vitis]
MLDKVTMINLVWTAMIGAMLATSIGFHMNEDRAPSNFRTSISQPYHSASR